jgi:hypothetical protein
MNLQWGLLAASRPCLRIFLDIQNLLFYVEYAKYAKRVRYIACAVLAGALLLLWTWAQQC